MKSERRLDCEEMQAEFGRLLFQGAANASTPKRKRDEDPTELSEALAEHRNAHAKAIDVLLRGLVLMRHFAEDPDLNDIERLVKEERKKVDGLMHDARPGAHLTLHKVLWAARQSSSVNDLSFVAHSVGDVYQDSLFMMNKTTTLQDTMYRVMRVLLSNLMPESPRIHSIVEIVGQEAKLCVAANGDQRVLQVVTHLCEKMGVSVMSKDE